MANRLFEISQTLSKPASDLEALASEWNRRGTHKMEACVLWTVGGSLWAMVSLIQSVAESVREEEAK